MPTDIRYRDRVRVLRYALLLLVVIASHVFLARIRFSVCKNGVSAWHPMRKKSAHLLVNDFANMSYIMYLIAYFEALNKLSPMMYLIFRLNQY